MAASDTSPSGDKETLDHCKAQFTRHDQSDLTGLFQVLQLQADT